MMLNLTVEQAKARVDSADKALARAKEFDGDYESINYAARALYGAEAVHSLIIANEAADKHVAEGSDPIPRAELIELVDEATRSKINFGAAVVDALEEAQREYGRWTRFDCKARAADGSWRMMSVKAWVRSLEAIEPYCPRRSDNSFLAPPWRLKLDGTGKVVPE